jgi:hypothetical protein
MSYDFQTSHPAYKEGNKDKCRSIVFTTIKNLGTCNDRQIAEHLGWPINSVTGRRNELVGNNLVECAHKSPDPLTKRTVNYWRVKSTTLTQKELFI